MKKRLSFLVVLMLGVALITTTGAAATAAIQATLSNHPVRVNGEYVDIQGYLIGGHNYYQLRDLGDLLGFEVEWDQDAHCVSITTDGAVGKAEVSTDDARYIPAVGDVITCSDGYRYEIKDISKRETSRRFRNCKDLPNKGNYYRRLFDYWWTLY